ncbi:Tn7-like element transposition protein TnsE [Alkaliphilus hydrothermalis]|uniref:TnsE C-terminal domain-containing protein n=1 Tax=Alkaliphilus hydrothermalis TaxID=1482730 RepID=A0ABS2NUA3_9FIRM|nr:Tn7-like element transposition protein TnsE [Alkaliphilus hydrothermalis]MBM7616164.1 hypothetical protein [Alkaliphilus hydrothermalis]
MGENNVFVKNWPFKPGEKAKLYWIDNPYKLSNKWVLDAYFKGESSFRKLTMDWADIHFLMLETYYQNGNLNCSQKRKDATNQELNLSNIKFNMIEAFLEVEIDGLKKKINTNIFVGYRNGIEYRIPAIEIIRSIICRSRFLLNRIVELDSLSNYFVYEIDNKNNLHINFFDGYERKLLKGEYVKHIAWMITNENILRMFNKVGQSLWSEGNLKYSFLFKDFKIRARINKKGNVVRVLEIMEFKNKIINAKEVYISSKYNKQLKRINSPKLRNYERLKETNDKTIDSKIDGAKNIESDFINTTETVHTYRNDVKVNKINKGEVFIRDTEDENTQTFEVQNEALRTTADTGGMDTARALEYENIDNVNIQGELEEFIEILRLLQQRSNIRSVEVVVDFLPEGKKGKKFAFLSDGITKRRYIVGKIVMNDTIFSLIEIERENRSLSMLLLYSRSNIDWNKVYLSVTLGLVNKSGTWDMKIVSSLQKIWVNANRIRHVAANKNLINKAEHIYNKLMEVH